MQEAVLQLIEVQLAQEEVTESPLGGDENAQLHASGYYALFVDTVPDDVKRLYTEAATSDFAALAQTAHRLKGVFAMLNLVPGKQLGETLEHLIREGCSRNKKYIHNRNFKRVAGRASFHKLKKIFVFPPISCSLNPSK